MSFVMDLPLLPAVATAPSPAAGVTLAVDSAVAIGLSELGVGEFATIHAVRATDNAGDAELVMRLIEIGFVPGERVRVIAIGRPGGQPIAVRLAAAADSGRRAINGATFALRRFEAEFIRVIPDAPRSASAGSS